MKEWEGESRVADGLLYLGPENLNIKQRKHPQTRLTGRLSFA